MKDVKDYLNLINRSDLAAINCPKQMMIVALFDSKIKPIQYYMLKTLLGH